MPTPPIMNTLFGSISWQPPLWLYRCRQYYKTHFWRANACLLVLCAFAAASYWAYFAYKNRPQPLVYSASAIAPQADIYINGQQGDPSSAYVEPATLVVEFDVAANTPTTKNLTGDPTKNRHFAADQTLQKMGVAKLNLQGKTLTAEQAKHISLTPSTLGQWQWQSENSLVFTPKQPWPAGQTYRLGFAHNKNIAPQNTIFNEKIIISDAQVEFKTLPLTVEITNSQFYQELTPKQNLSRQQNISSPPTWQVLSTLQFSHPVDIESVKKALQLKMAYGASAKQWRNHDYTLSHGPHQRNIYIRSTNVAPQEQEGRMHIILAAGVQALSKGKTTDAVSGSVMIPSTDNYFKLTKNDTQIVNNNEGKPEQILTLEFSDAVNIKSVRDNVKLYLLPKKNPINKRHWSSPAEVTKAALKQARIIALDPIANEQEIATLHSFKYDTAQNRDVYLLIKKGLTSKNGFSINSQKSALLRSPAYPKTLNIMGHGALLSHSGEHKIPLVSRGINAINMQLYKIQPNQINHLVSQTYGDISSPEFNHYNFDGSNIGIYSEHRINLSRKHPSKANYAAYDLSRHIEKDNHIGLFLVKAQAWNTSKNRPHYGIEDKRLILITDLGILVKNNSDQSQEVFVQSIKTGLPVAGATVKLLGKNGLTIMQGTTDETGHAHFASAQNYSQGKTPTAYVVSQTSQQENHSTPISDTAFIPYRNFSRELNYSRFDVAGTRKQQGNQNPLSAYIFTDRGIYRPGDTVNIAAIVKREDFSAIAGIPLEVEIRDPKGNSLLTKRIQLPKFGFFELPFSTQHTSNTGRYSAYIYLMRNKGKNRYRDKQLGVVDFQVEEFQPDRLKIKTQFTLKQNNPLSNKPLIANNKGWVTAPQLVANMQLNNLFGAPAQNRRATAKLTLKPIRFYFKAYSDYQFTDPLLNTQAQAKNIITELPATTTDGNGQANFTIDLSQYTAGTYNISLQSQGYEADGGRSVQANINQWVSPLNALVGHKSASNLNYLKRNSEHSIDFININSSLKATARKQLSLALIEERYISTLVKQRNGTYSYQSVKKRIPVSEQIISITEQGYSHPLITTTAGDFLLELKEGDTVISRAYYSVAGQGNISGKLEKNAELNVKLNKTDYAPGETIELSITAPYQGAGLITIESDRVHAHQWFTSHNNRSIAQITLPKHIEGNAYINVAFVRAIDSDEIFTSPLSYAAVPFNIDRSARQMSVKLKAPATIKPGQTLSIDYSTTVPSRIALFAVDEGILQVAQYRMPNPLAHFMQKRALEVSTQQILDLILPEFNLLKKHAGVGGGAAAMQKALANNLNPFSRKADKPAVFWAGIKEANNQIQTTTFTLPDTFAGNLRIMAVAVGDNTLGTASTSTLVRGPFVLSPNVLTVAAPGDEFEVSLGVANGAEHSSPKAAVTVSLIASKHLELIGDSQQILTIGQGSEGKATFKLRAQQAVGIASLNFSASLIDDKGILQTSTRSASLSVRPATNFRSTFTAGISQGNTLKNPQNIPVQRQLLNALASNKITASSAPIALTDGLLSYLNYYPHLCTEQIISRVFPLLGFFEHPQLDDAKNREANYKILLQALSARQQNNGRFSHWPNSGSNFNRSKLDTNKDFPTLYALHFLTEAKALGLSVPDNLLTRGYDYLRELARLSIDVNTNNNHILEQAHLQAYALYLLTRSGEVTTNHLVNLQETLTKHQAAQNKKQQDFTWKSDITGVYMAATYQLLKQNKIAIELIKNYTLSDSRTSNNSGYHSPLALNAQYIYIATKHFNTQALGINEKSMQQFLTPLWHNNYNTLSASFATLALSAYSTMQSTKNIDQSIQFSAITKDAAGNSIAQDLSIKKEDENDFPQASFNVATNSIALSANAPVFYALQQNGYDATPSAKAIAKNIEISREYQNSQGQMITKAKQGDEITIVLRTRSLTGKAITNSAIIDLLPGGFEIQRESLDSYSVKAHNNNNKWQPDYIDIREDRLVFYGTLTPQMTELRYKAKVTARGNFITPAAVAQSMYDLATYAHTAAGQFTVLEY